MKGTKNKVSRKETVKNWYERNKNKIVIIGTFAGSTLLIFGSCLLAKKSVIRKMNIKMPEIDNAPFCIKEAAKRIDKDIFTSLAPQIEDAVLDESIDKIIFDRVYELEPVVSKLVTVNIETTYGD